MKIDPKSIEEAFISHHHDDHRRGIYWVFEKNPAMKVHFRDSFDIEAYRAADQVKMKPNRVKGPFELMPGVYSTGPIDGLPLLHGRLDHVHHTRMRTADGNEWAGPTDYKSTAAQLRQFDKILDKPSAPNRQLQPKRCSAADEHSNSSHSLIR